MGASGLSGWELSPSVLSTLPLPFPADYLRKSRLPLGAAASSDEEEEGEGEGEGQGGEVEAQDEDSDDPEVRGWLAAMELPCRRSRHV